MKHSYIGLVALAAMMIAGCGGGSDTKELEDKVASLEKEVETLEGEKEELEKRPTEEQARQREAAARNTAESERDAANQRAADAEEAKEKAEEELEKVTEAVNKPITRILREDAKRIHMGMSDTAPVTGATVNGAVTPLAARLKHNSPAMLTTPNLPGVTGILGSSLLRGWQKTTFSNEGTNTDEVEIYSNIEHDERVDFKNSGISTDGQTLFDSNGRTYWGGADGTNDGGYTLVASDSSRAAPAFPTSGGDSRTYSVGNSGLRDNGPTQAQVDSASSGDADFGKKPRIGTRLSRHPLRYSIELSGTLQGARGIFRCGGNDDTASCVITKTGEGNFIFTGGWRFFPSSSAKVNVPDAEYMWFGWWSRKTDTEEGTYVHHGVVNPDGVSSGFVGATGTATYVGPAVGRYVVVDPIGENSSAERFEAKATLTADFEDGSSPGSISGRITDFSNELPWIVMLNSGAISGTMVPAGNVSWSIGTAKNGDGTLQNAEVEDGGQWTASLHSNFEGATGAERPTGIAGAFTAQHGTQRRMVGAFGTQRQ